MQPNQESVQYVREALGEEGLEAIYARRDQAKEVYEKLSEGAQVTFEEGAALTSALLAHGVTPQEVIAGLELVKDLVKSTEELTKEYIKEEV